jgi:hypothetical protein
VVNFRYSFNGAEKAGLILRTPEVTLPLLSFDPAQKKRDHPALRESLGDQSIIRLRQPKIFCYYLVTIITRTSSDTPATH